MEKALPWPAWLLNFFTVYPFGYESDLDDALIYALHQMHHGAYRHVPVVDAQRRPTALVSIQVMIDELVAAFPQELLNLPPSPAHAIAPTPEGA